MSLESEAATDKEARQVLADLLESQGQYDLANWWRSPIFAELKKCPGEGAGSGHKLNATGIGFGRGSRFGDVRIESGGSGRGVMHELYVGGAAAGDRKQPNWAALGQID